MNQTRWARSFLAALILCVLWLIATHWQEKTKIVYTSYTISPVSSVTAVDWPNGEIDVNTATAEELLMLDGINQSQVEALLADREENGDFDYPEDLIAVNGIGKKTLAKIYDQLDFTWRENGN